MLIGLLAIMKNLIKTQHYATKMHERFSLFSVFSAPFLELFNPNLVVNLPRFTLVNLNRQTVVNLNRRTMVNYIGASTLSTIIYKLHTRKTFYL